MNKLIEGKGTSGQTSKLKAPRSAKATQEPVVPSERSFSLDPAFKNFDYDAYESEIMKNGRKHDISESKAFFNSVFDRLAKGRGFSPSADEVVSPSSVKVLKAAPGENTRHNEQSKQEVFLGTELKSFSSDPSDTAGWNRLDNSERSTENPNSRETVGTRSSREDEGKSQVLRTASEVRRNASQQRMDRVSAYINQLTSIFMSKMERLEIAENLNVTEKLQKQNNLFKDWMNSIYEQYTVCVDAFEELEEVIASNLKDYREKTNKLKKKLSKLESENRIFKKSYTKLTKNLNAEVEELKASQAGKDASLEQCQTDLKVLMGLIIRLRHGGIWNCKGMKDKLSLEVYNKLFKDQEDLSGKRLQCIDNLEEERTKLRVNIQEMKLKQEKVRSSLRKKDSDLEKVKREEQRALKVLADAKAEKSRLVKEIEELKLTRSSLESRTTSAALDEFVTM